MENENITTFESGAVIESNRMNNNELLCISGAVKDEQVRGGECQYNVKGCYETDVRSDNSFVNNNTGVDCSSQSSQSSQLPSTADIDVEHLSSVSYATLEEFTTSQSGSCVEDTNNAISDEFLSSHATDAGFEQFQSIAGEALQEFSQHMAPESEDTDSVISDKFLSERSINSYHATTVQHQDDNPSCDNADGNCAANETVSLSATETSDPLSADVGSEPILKDYDIISAKDAKMPEEFVFVTDHFSHDTDRDSITVAKFTNDDRELFSVNLANELSEVGKYSYAGLVAHSLFILYRFTNKNQKFQEQCIKQLLLHLSLSKQVESTMMMVTSGQVDMQTADPFIASLKKDPFLLKTGLHCVPYDLFVRSLNDGVYDARIRTLIKLISLELGVDWRRMEALEESVLELFIENQHEPTEEEMTETRKARRNKKIKQGVLIGLATIGGGVLIGLTAGLAAPLIAAGAGAVIGGAGAGILGTTAGIAVIGSLFGVAGAGLTGYKMNKRVGNLEEFEFEPLAAGRSLHVTIAVSGWLSDDHSDFKDAWLGLANCKEQYTLKFESKYLRPLGKALDYIIGVGVSVAVKQGLQYTVLSGLLAAIAWPAALISVAGVIDNPWSVVTHRSVNAGKQLAEVLLSRQQGTRPVTLIGYSFGARVIFSCLQEMATRKNCEGIVEEAILLGAPVTGSADEWSKLSSVVSGRIINGYSEEDWLLKFMYRTASVQLTVAGLGPVKWTNRLMQNIDLTPIVSGHRDYFVKIDEVLEVIGIPTKPHADPRSADSLKQWSNIMRVEKKKDSDHEENEDEQKGLSKK